MFIKTLCSQERVTMSVNLVPFQQQKKTLRGRVAECELLTAYRKLSEHRVLLDSVLATVF